MGRRSNSITRLLQLPDKGVNDPFGPKGVIPRLFRQMLWNLQITPQKYGALLASYVRDPRNRVPDNRQDRAQHIGNLTKELGKTGMTMKVMLKALRLLQFTDVEIIIRGRSRITRGEVTEHSIHLNMGDYSELDEIENQEKQSKGSNDHE